MLIANVEADELLMQVITSIRKQDYLIKYKSGAVIKNNRRHNKRDLIKQLNRVNKVNDQDYNLELDYKYGTLDTAVFLLERKLRKIQYLTKCDVMNLWIGPDDGSNFRYKSAKTQAYKNNRSTKPEILIQLRQYLINIKGAQVIYGYESDDALGIYQKDYIKENLTDDIWTDMLGNTFETHLAKYSGTVAVHCDKDIFMIPGLHFNTMTDQFEEVDNLGHIFLNNGAVKGRGLAFFYFQMLYGDSTDTIPNIKRGWGEVKCYKFLEECYSEEDYLTRVIDAYNTLIIDTDWKERLLEQADLVWICRDKEEKGSDYIKRRYKEITGYGL